MISESDGIKNEQLNEIRKELHEINRTLKVIAHLSQPSDYYKSR